MLVQSLEDRGVTEPEQVDASVGREGQRLPGRHHEQIAMLDPGLESTIPDEELLGDATKLRELLA
jgi:hypothetical protein